jgi:hypothetical protein
MIRRPGLTGRIHPGRPGPPLSACPSPSQVRRVLERKDRALACAKQEWERLPQDLREALRPPEEMIAPE